MTFTELYNALSATKNTPTVAVFVGCITRCTGQAVVELLHAVAVLVGAGRTRLRNSRTIRAIMTRQTDVTVGLTHGIWLLAASRAVEACKHFNTAG